MKIEIKKIDISDEVKYSTPITIELFRSGDLWKIEVPDIIEIDELIHQLSISDDLVNKYTEILRAVLKSYNYKNVWENVKNRFICSSATQINKSLILPSTIEISNDFSKYGIERKSWSGDCYRYRGFGTVINNELISWCIENTLYLGDGSTEIGVQTDVNNRKNGYAVSNVVALCDYLIKNGVSTIYYECALDNIASFRTAQKANLEYLGEVFYLVFEN